MLTVRAVVQLLWLKMISLASAGLAETLPAVSAETITVASPGGGVSRRMV